MIAPPTELLQVLPAVDQQRDHGAIRGRGANWIFALGLIALTFLAYGPVWHAGFIWDDDTFLLTNPLIQKSDGLRQFWFTTAAPDYFPATSTTLWLEWRLWGTNPLGYHLVNVLLHALSAVLLWRILAAMEISGAILAAAIFAVHPVNVESVAWVTERKNTLSMVFYLLSIFWYLGFDKCAKAPSTGTAADSSPSVYYWLSILAFVLGLLSKSAVAPLPVVLLGIVWWQQKRISVRALLRTIPYFALAAAAAMVSIWFQYHRAIGASMVVVRHDSFLSRVAGAGWGVWFYLFKALAPLKLSFVYPKWHVDAAHLFSWLPDLLLLAAFVAAWWHRRSWGRALLFALGYFVVLLLPTLGFLNIYFMRYSLVADHWQYFAIIGPIVYVAAGVALLARAQLPWISQAVGAALVVLLAALTWGQSLTYRDVETLWIKTIEKNPAAILALNNLGNLRLEQGRLDEATGYFQKALAIEPDSPDVLSNLGATFLRQGRVEDAIAEFREALKLEPGSAQANNNLGSALLQQGKFDEALVHLRKVAEIQPNTAAVEDILGNALLQAGNAEEALAHLQKAVQLQPNLADAQLDLGNALSRVGQNDAALLHLRRAVELQPGLAPAHYGLANTLLQSGNLDAAVMEFKRTLEIEPGFAAAQNGWGNALIRKGRIAEAVGHYDAAIALLPQNPYLLNNLAWILATCPEASIRNGSRALELAQQANELAAGKSPVFLSTMAAAYAESGKFAEATDAARRALDLANAQGNTAQTGSLGNQLKLYESGSPVRDGGLAPRSD